MSFHYFLFQTSYEYALSQCVDCIREIKSAVESRHLNVKDDECILKETGQFTKNVMKLQRILLGSRLDLDTKELTTLADDVVRHCMSTSHLCVSSEL